MSSVSSLLHKTGKAGRPHTQSKHMLVTYLFHFIHGEGWGVGLHEMAIRI